MRPPLVVSLWLCWWCLLILLILVDCTSSATTTAYSATIEQEEQQTPPIFNVKEEKFEQESATPTAESVPVVPVSAASEVVVIAPEGEEEDVQGDGGEGAVEVAGDGDKGGTTLNILGGGQQAEEGEDSETPTTTTTTTIINTNKPPSSSNRGTAYTAGTPFQFKYIFVIGGDCDEPLGWLSRWVKAAMDTLGAPNSRDAVAGLAGGNANNYTHLENICSTGPLYYEYKREFQLQALQRVYDKVGPTQINQTLVIADQALWEDYTPVVRLMKQGMGYFHGGGNPLDLSINLTKFGLTPSQVFYLYFALDEDIAAKESGREVCRLKGASHKEINIAKLYSNAPPARIHTAIAAFKDECPNTKINVVWEMQRDEGENNFTEYKTTLRFHTLPDIIFTLQDAAAKDILKTAQEVLPADEASKITATGWDDNEPALLRQKKLLTSVDQMVFHPNRGLWYKINTIIAIAQEQGINSTAGLQKTLKIPTNSTTIWTSCVATSSDQIGFLINKILKGYETLVPPNLNVHVSTGLFDVSVIKMIPFEGKFNSIIWLKMSWIDKRLTWSPYVYNGTLEMQSDQIWYPKLYFQNKIIAPGDSVLYTSAATVTPQGYVTLKINFNEEFLCSTRQELVSFPFDSYKCHINLTAPSGISLDQRYGFQVIEEDPHFSLRVATYDADSHEHSNNHSHSTSDSGDEDYPYETVYGEETVSYILYFGRRPFTAWVRLILPAILINMIGFLAFWIDEAAESVALGVTSLLCALTFRETVEMPDTADVTWTEVFLMVNVCYQASVMLIIWLSYGDKSRFSSSVDKCFQYIHPKKVTDKVAEGVKKTPEIAAKTTSVASQQLKQSCVSMNRNLSQLQVQSQMQLQMASMRLSSLAAPRLSNGADGGGGGSMAFRMSNNDMPSMRLSGESMPSIAEGMDESDTDILFDGSYEDPDSGQRRRDSNRRPFDNDVVVVEDVGEDNSRSDGFVVEGGGGGGGGNSEGFDEILADTGEMDEESGRRITTSNNNNTTMTSTVIPAAPESSLPPTVRYRKSYLTKNTRTGRKQQGSAAAAGATTASNGIIGNGSATSSGNSSSIPMTISETEVTLDTSLNSNFSATARSGAGDSVGSEGDDDDDSNNKKRRRRNSRRRFSIMGTVKEENGGDDENDVGPTNVDWIGRWIIVPSYVIVMGTLLANGWGYTGSLHHG